jgi:hypothetical protein
MAEIYLKRSNARSLISATDFGGTNAKNWSKFFQTGRTSTKSSLKKPIMGRISAKLKEIQPKSVAEIKLRPLNHFYTNFSHFGRK